MTDADSCAAQVTSLLLCNDIVWKYQRSWANGLELHTLDTPLDLCETGRVELARSQQRPNSTGARHTVLSNARLGM